MTEIGHNFTDSLYDYGRMHLDIFRVTNVPKFRNFQYRLLQRAIITNTNLFKWGLVPSNLCSFCQLEEENIVHLLFQCQEVQYIWNKFQNYLQQRYNIQNISLGIQERFANRIINNPNHFANFMCLIVKQYIYRTRCLKESLQLSVSKDILPRLSS